MMSSDAIAQWVVDNKDKMASLRDNLYKVEEYNKWMIQKEIDQLPENLPVGVARWRRAHIKASHSDSIFTAQEFAYRQTHDLEQQNFTLLRVLDNILPD